MPEMIDIETIQDPTLRQQILAARSKLGGAPGMQAYPKSDEGMQGFGGVNKDTLKNAAGSLDDRVAFAMMNSGNEPVAGGGGLIAAKSPFAAAAEGLKQGIGTYGMLSGIKAKRDTAGELGGILSPKSKSKALRNAVLGDFGDVAGGQHSVQGDADYINDL